MELYLARYYVIQIYVTLLTKYHCQEWMIVLRAHVENYHINACDIVSANMIHVLLGDNVYNLPVLILLLLKYLLWLNINYVSFMYIGN